MELEEEHLDSHKIKGFEQEILVQRRMVRAHKRYYGANLFLPKVSAFTLDDNRNDTTLAFRLLSLIFPRNVFNYQYHADTVIV